MVDFVKKYVDLLDVNEGWGFYFDKATEPTRQGRDYILTEEDAEKIAAKAYIYKEISLDIYSKGDAWIYVVITSKMIDGEDDEYFIDATTEREEGEERQKTYTAKGEEELKNVLLAIVKEKEEEEA